MPKSALVFLIAALILLGGLWFFFFYNVETNGNQESDANSNGRESLGVPAPGNEDVDEMIVEDSGDEVEGSSGTTKTVRINVEGYNPRVLEINAGDTVRWINEASRSNWPASDVHPSHTIYPGSSRSKCGTAEENEIFDACRGLDQGESYSFTFNAKGRWEYHDHLRASMKGTIVVN